MLKRLSPPIELTCVDSLGHDARRLKSCWLELSEGCSSLGWCLGVLWVTPLASPDVYVLETFCVHVRWWELFP